VCPRAGQPSLQAGWQFRAPGGIEMFCNDVDSSSGYTVSNVRITCE